MSNSTAKLLRRLFKDRKQYRWFKHKYNCSTTEQKIKTRSTIQKMIREHKEIKNISI